MHGSQGQVAGETRMSGVNYIKYSMCCRCGIKYEKSLGLMRCPEPDCNAKLRTKPQWSGKPKRFKRI